ncbi:MAG: SDR family oxidoreductase [Candidatus Nanopelagicales bacterium]
MHATDSATAHVGKGVVVTGGAKGIGLGIAQRFVREGATVIIADIDMDAATEAVRDLGERAIAMETDVRDEDSLRLAVEVAVESAGQLDVMVNNAGIIAVAPLIETDAAQWIRLLDINVVGVAMGSKVAAKQMIAQGRGGCIVNASSGGGRHGVANVSQYCASKAAIIMLSQSLSQELAADKIRVNCYTPGHIMTPLWEDILSGMGEALGRSREETLEAFLATIPWGRFGTPEDVASTVSWLCTPDAEYISGQCIAMNGAELPW